MNWHFNICVFLTWFGGSHGSDEFKVGVLPVIVGYMSASNHNHRIIPVRAEHILLQCSVLIWGLLPAGRPTLTHFYQLVSYLADGKGCNSWKNLSHADNFASRWWCPAASAATSKGIIPFIYSDDDICGGLIHVPAFFILLVQPVSSLFPRPFAPAALGTNES